MAYDLAGVREIVKGLPRDHADRLAESHEDTTCVCVCASNKTPISANVGGVKGGGGGVGKGFGVGFYRPNSCVRTMR